jgi:hypothetical protein
MRAKKGIIKPGGKSDFGASGTVVCFDPGQSIGVATLKRKFERVGSCKKKTVERDQFCLFKGGVVRVKYGDGWIREIAENRAVFAIVEDMRSLYWAPGDYAPLTDVVIEDFILRERTMDKNLLSPVRIAQALMMAIDADGMAVRVHLQTPADKATVTDRMLRKEGWLAMPVSGPMRHANDAARHLHLFRARARDRGVW